MNASKITGLFFLYFHQVPLRCNTGIAEVQLKPWICKGLPVFHKQVSLLFDRVSLERNRNCHGLVEDRRFRANNSRNPLNSVTVGKRLFSASMVETGNSSAIR